MPSDSNRLPWRAGVKPLMLAPMQGLTNHALRNLLCEWVAPDIVFTEFIRVSNVSRKRVAGADLRDIAESHPATPLVAQLVGSGCHALVDAARQAQDAGARHLNLNLGCPYGRMTSRATGGKLLQHPEQLQEILPALRRVACGSFSVKLRAGYADPEEIFELLPIFENAGVDFLILHPRTVLQEYRSAADHSITARVLQRTSLPLIANGDIFTAAAGERLLQREGIAGLMLGRGAIADPLLFARLRQEVKSPSNAAERRAVQCEFLLRLIPPYVDLFCGEAQVMTKLKGVLSGMGATEFGTQLQALKRTRTLADFRSCLQQIGGLRNDSG